MRYNNDVSDAIGFLQIVKIYCFMKENKLYALNITFLFVKSELSNF